MTHKKQEYTHNGHEVTVQQVNEGGNTSAWIDGWSVYVSHIVDSDNQFDASLDDFNAVQEIADWMAENTVLFCQNCHSFYHIDRAVGTGFAGHQCPECANKRMTCEDGGEHDDKCLNPRQKHNARVPTKYKCQKCGRIRKTTPTG